MTLFSEDREGKECLANRLAEQKRKRETMHTGGSLEPGHLCAAQENALAHNKEHVEQWMHVIRLRPPLRKNNNTSDLRQPYPHLAIREHTPRNSCGHLDFINAFFET
jgi:hypothetical protein